MKRNYNKPEISTLQLRLNTFLTAGSGSGNNDATHNVGGETGDGKDPIYGAGEGDESRSWGRGMWDDM